MKVLSKRVWEYRLDNKQNYIPNSEQNLAYPQQQDRQEGRNGNKLQSLEHDTFVVTNCPPLLAPKVIIHDSGLRRGSEVQCYFPAQRTTNRIILKQLHQTFTTERMTTRQQHFLYLLLQADTAGRIVCVVLLHPLLLFLPLCHLHS